MDSIGKCYKNNFIKKVIAKIEFVEPVSIFTPETMTDVIKEIKTRFPISEQTTAFQQEVKISKEGVDHSKIDFPEWIFHGTDRKKYLKVNRLFIEVLLTKYETEDDFRNDLILPISHLLKINKDILIRRTGIRFINVFDFKIENFTKASNYFSKAITAHFSHMVNVDKCSRAFMINEFVYDDIKLRVQTGFFNPDYPAVIKRNHFVVDLDAYIDIPHTINDTENYFSRLHDIIEENFELLITDELRNKILNG